MFGKESIIMCEDGIFRNVSSGYAPMMFDNTLKNLRNDCEFISSEVAKNANALLFRYKYDSGYDNLMCCVDTIFPTSNGHRMAINIRKRDFLSHYDLNISVFCGFTDIGFRDLIKINVSKDCYCIVNGIFVKVNGSK